MSNNTIQIVIIDKDPAMRDVIRKTFGADRSVDIIAETDSLIYGYELIRQNKPQLVFIDLRDDGQSSLDIVNRISTFFKDTLIFLSGNEFDLDTVMSSMQAGAREYIQRPLDPDALVQVFNKHRAAMATGTAGDTTGRILTVFSNKGGLGKTTISVNLALALSEVVNKPVALVDLNLQLGDITTFLDIAPQQTIVDIANNIGRVDATYLESSLAKFEHNNSRVYVLADPLNVEEAEEVTADQINTVLTVLKASFEYVVIDTTTSFDSKTLTALDLADNILLVSMVNLPNIRSSQRVMTLFDRLGYEKQKLKLIVNRYVAEDEITIEDVEDTLEHEVYWKIPNNYQAVMTAINRGVPLDTVEKGKDIYENFQSLAKKVSGVIDNSGKKVTDKTEVSDAPEKKPGLSIFNLNKK